MKLNYKYGIVFFIIYVIASFASVMLLYSWTAFGGGSSLNFIQKAIIFFFDFPSRYLKINAIILGVLINALFWSLFFVFARYLYTRMMKSRKTAH
ncbi:MAG: hypothetical protein AAGD17_07020 [Bacteroidota bacterium]